jgi:4-amino-4-deoxy-L-arabinose transferase-like glycosyltransferase
LSIDRSLSSTHNVEAANRSPLFSWWVVLVGAALRIAILTDNRFHPDEALFATLGRLIVQGIDPLLSNTHLLVDKPPLFYYLLAGGISMSWAHELTARMPALFASVIGMALLARLARQLWRSKTAIILTGLFLAMSPFAILFSPTVFADTPMMMWWLASLVAVNSRRWGWAGLLFGLALATKQNALFLLPLVIGLGIVQSVDDHISWRQIVIWLARFLLGLGVILVAVVIWDISRRPADSFWTAGFDVNNPGRLIRSNEIGPRLLSWSGWLRFFTGEIGFTVLVAVLIAVLPVLELRQQKRSRASAASLVLLAFMIGYLVFHWLVAFPVLDRYLLPLVPVTALLIGRTGQLISEYFRDRWTRQVVPITGIILLMAWPAYQTTRNAYPVGGDHGAFDGIDQVADYLNQQPVGTIVYYQSLGWSLNYYLFDAYIYLAPFGSPAALEADLATFGSDQHEPPRFVVLPGWESHTEVLAAAAQAGYQADIELETFDRAGNRSLVVYRLLRVD